MQQFHTFKKIIDRFVKPAVIVEAGANDCHETVAFAEAYPNAEIHAYECNPYNIALCETRIHGHANINLHKMALSDHVGTLTFHPMPENQAASSVFKHTTVEQETIEVPCTTLPYHADVLWLDAEGSELAMLKGMDLSATSLIHIEVYFKEMFIGQPLYWDIKQYLNSKNFDLLTFTSLGRHFCDAVFINRELYRRKTPQWTTELLNRLSERLRGHTRRALMSLRIRGTQN